MPRLIITKKLHTAHQTPANQPPIPPSTQPITTVRGRDPQRYPLIIACTRFNNKTWQEYQNWLTANKQAYEQTYCQPLKCIYGSPREMPHKKIPPHAQILVIEMNNDENRIMGIGQIQNKTASEIYRRHTQPPTHTQPISQRIVFSRLFSERNYTRYIYIGNEYYASREELERNHTQDAQYINEQLIHRMPQTPHSHSHSHPHPLTREPNQSHQPHHPQQQEETIIQYLERLLFKGAKHMKRGSGITRCPFMK